MKHLLFIIFVIFTISASGQTITKRKKLKTTDLGNQRLEVAINDNDTVYSIIIHNGSASKNPFPVILGDKNESLRLLHFLLDTELEKDDYVNLENPTHNFVKKGASKDWLIVFSEGKAFDGYVRKGNIKVFIKAIHQFCGDEVLKDDEDEE